MIAPSRDNLGMSQTEFFIEPATILRMPSWLGSQVHEDRELPLTPGDYKVTPGDSWTVTCPKTNATIYSGIGPVTITRAHAKD
ncbi:hypothetical protein QFZ47_005481 [Variovorax paradoxus]|nr:hypothetical protein [Variovorax paradoxus]